MSSSGEDAAEHATKLEDLVAELRAGRTGRVAPGLPASPAEGSAVGSPTSMAMAEPFMVDSTTGDVLRDLTTDAVWSVSTAKVGNGVDQLVDGVSSTYWQSDGVQPHRINAQFASKRKVTTVLLFLNYSTDESYTPAVVSVRAGTNFHDLKVVRRAVEFNDPEGWCSISLDPNVQDSEEDEDDEDGDGEFDSENEDEEEGEDDGDGAHLEAVNRQQRRSLRADRRRRRKEAATAKLAAKGGYDSDEGVVCVGSDEATNYIKAHMLQIVIHCNHQNGRDSHVRMIKLLGPQRQVAVKHSKFTSKEFQMYQNYR